MAHTFKTDPYRYQDDPVFPRWNSGIRRQLHKRVRRATSRALSRVMSDPSQWDAYIDWDMHSYYRDSDKAVSDLY